MRSIKVKNFSFGMFNYKTKFFKEIGKNIKTIEETTVRNVKRFALWDEKTIINKRNDGIRDF